MGKHAAPMTRQHKKKISSTMLGKPKTAEHIKNMTKAALLRCDLNRKRKRFVACCLGFLRGIKIVAEPFATQQRSLLKMAEELEPDDDTYPTDEKR